MVVTKRIIIISCVASYVTLLVCSIFYLLEIINIVSYE